jgi:hypothetical protein
MVAGSGARAAAFWEQGDIRQRWWALVMVGVLIGLRVGFALSALVGVRRTDTALDQISAADAIAFPSQVGVSYPHWIRLRAHPEVKTVAVWDLLFGDYNGREPSLLFGSAWRPSATLFRPE